MSNGTAARRSRRIFAAAAASFLAFAAGASAQARFERASVDSTGVEANKPSPVNGAAFSSDGRFVAFDSTASNLAPWDLNNASDVFVHDRSSGATVLISTALTGLAGNSSSNFGGISADGRFVVFDSAAGDLVRYDSNQLTDVFLCDRDPDGNGIFDEGNDVVTRVSVDSAGNQANGSSYMSAISADGTKVAFASDARNLVASDTNSATDVFLHDVATGTTELISLSSAGVQGNQFSGEPTLSSDGALVCFASDATNLVPKDTNSTQDVFLRDRGAGTTRRMSVKSNGGEANNGSYDPTMSSDGARIAFWSGASNLVAGDTNNASDVFLHDVASGATTCVDVNSSGAPAKLGAQRSILSSSGDFLVFYSASTDLAGIETNNTIDAFEADLTAGTLRKVSVHPSGQEGDNGSWPYAVSDDGSLVAFYAAGFDLIGSDANNVQDLLVRDYAVPDIFASRSSYGAGLAGTLGIPTLDASADPVMGTTITIDIGNSQGVYAVGFLLVGVAPSSLPSHGGTMLVDPLLTLPLLVAPTGTSLSGGIPLEDADVGVSIYLQALEIDPGAVLGVSFTAGLQLTLGQ
jgi:hypothetical protein